MKALAQTEQRAANEENGQFYRGNLKNRDVLETDNSIIMLGDVYPGSAIISAKNIIILGGLYGEAYAGGNGRESGEQHRQRQEHHHIGRALRESPCRRQRL